ncbi:MAG: hypothetical protein H0X37_13030 [Herpetosiphonaceae bacterium]|nr:hypothetical protein [Herpetosiphonaceae bacterium]
MRDLTIEEGGQLLAGLRAEVLVPLGVVETAVRLYLQTLVDTMGEPDEACLNLPTTTYVSGAHRLWMQAGRLPCTIAQLGALDAHAHAVNLGSDLRQWLGELPTTREVALWFGLGTASGELETAERSHELQGIWERLLLPRTVAEVLRHSLAVVLIDPAGLATAAVLRRLARRLARLQLDPAVVQLVEPELAWPGPLLLPFFVVLRDLANTLEAAPHDDIPLLQYLARQLGAQPHDALNEFLEWRLAGDSVLLLLESLEDVVDAQRRAWVVQAVVHFRRRWPQARVVLTSRDSAQRERARLDFHFTIIQPPSAAQAQ